MASDPTTAFSAPQPLRQYRCACGHQIAMDSSSLELVCQQCGRRVALAAMNENQTLSFCSPHLALIPSDRRPSEDRVGEQLGYFRLEEKLGEGGMGAVYRALDESLQRYVAVKVMRASSSGIGSSAHRVSRLLDEAVAQARVSHPNIVTIYFVGRDEAEPFFAMELLPGPTLEAELRDGALPYQRVVRYALQVVGALRQSSHLGLVHGDIKPSNLILANREAVKLGDFGLAKTPEMAVSQGISGTLSYLAPELVDGEPPSEKSDMYALGVTLFELTFGRRPYALFGDTLTDQMNHHRVAEVEFPEKWPNAIPLGWRNILEKLLAKDPQARYANYDALLLDLKSLTPVGVTQAGFLTRSLAFAVDTSIMGMLLLPFVIPPTVASFSPDFNGAPVWLITIVHQLWILGLFAPSVPALWAWLEWKGFQTPGRYLFQLRVVDAHGLPLDPQRRCMRSIGRNSMVWLNAISIVLMSLGLWRLSSGLGVLDELSLVINCLPILGPKRLVLHDRICGSHVVLDTLKNSRAQRS